MPSEAAVAQAGVRSTGTANNQSRDTTTNASGDYSFPSDDDDQSQLRREDLTSLDTCIG
jgi:hypothetical protein